MIYINTPLIFCGCSLKDQCSVIKEYWQPSYRNTNIMKVKGCCLNPWKIGILDTKEGYIYLIFKMGLLHYTIFNINVDEKGLKKNSEDKRRLPFLLKLCLLKLCINISKTSNLD